MKRKKRRRKKSPWRKAIAILLSTAMVLGFTYARDKGLIPQGYIPQWMDKSHSENAGSAYCERVVDGDTIVVKINGKKEKVRLIGVDTPESVHPDQSRNTPEGKIASQFTKDHLEGKYVRLETDVQERDKYGRLLAYVYLGDEMFNKTLLKEGLARLMTIPPNVKYVDEFKAVQAENLTHQ